ncbi:lysozyme [Ostrea edulis]|uniref:lysozyme n=1 Tax=Ostrea edulis TaxID=37623 RepID=UPI0024AFCF6C|nr:lysozyme [Ostrea edulis]XP_056003280.1 lysozyme [Ostrea edulis]
MSAVLVLALVLLSLTCVTDAISDACLTCICKQESYGCTQIGCRMDGGSLSCGYFQIKKSYWIDCGRLGSSWEACADDYNCAVRCVRAYMKKYIGNSGCTANCKNYARLHNGGPKGCTKPSTLTYWNDVKNQGCSINS